MKHGCVKVFAFSITVLLQYLIPAVSFAQNGRVWATYYGGASFDYAYDVATDDSGNVYVAGVTGSTVSIASGGFQNTYGGTVDAYLAKFDASGNRLWATYYGGPGADYAYGVATDKNGNVYIVGQTSSSSGIAFGGYQNTIGGSFDAYLAKFDASGNRLWATYYGGGKISNNDDKGFSVTTDTAGNVYMAGITKSDTGIASAGFQNAYGGGGNFDAFLVKFNSNGNRLWGTYYGGSEIEWGNGVATDVAGNVFLAGRTDGNTGIASGGHQNTFGGVGDAFLVKFNASGNRQWATYYGGPANDEGYGVATDALGNIYLSGLAKSTTAIASGGHQNSYGGGAWDAFLTKFDASGTRLWATYYGGAAVEGVNTSIGAASGLAVDTIGNVYLAGRSSSTTAIASAGFQNSHGTGTWDVYLVKFNSVGTRLCATYYGDAGADEGYAVATDNSGNVYLAGRTDSPSGIGFGGFQNTYGAATDAFLTKFTSCFNPLYVSANDTNVLCYGQCNGIAAANPTYGTGAYTYSWNTNPTQTTQIATGLCAGVYTVTVTDALANITTATVNVTEPSALLSDTLGLSHVSCNALCDAVVTATVSGGVFGSTYLWSNGQTNNIATGLCAGNYTFTVSDANNCINTLSVTITQPPAITGTTTITDASCNSFCNAIITSTISGGFSTYSWTSGQTNSSATGLCAGNYTLTVTDANNCTARLPVIVSQPAAIVTAATISNVSCNALCNAVVTSTISGGQPGYGYLWSNGQTNSSATGLCAGNYTLTVTDANNCTIELPVIVTQPAAISLAINVADASCVNNDGVATAVVNGGTSAYTYLWNPAMQTSASITGLVAGIYNATVTDANGCQEVQTATVASLPTGFVASASASPGTIISGSTSQLAVTSGQNYQWYSAEGLSCITCAAPLASPTQTSTYCVIVAGNGTCIDTTCVTIHVDSLCKGIFVPNVFSPNNDGQNDKLVIYGDCYKINSFVIYNRWGEKVFVTTDINEKWDGTYKGDPANTDVYTYILNGEFPNAEKVLKKGIITLIR